MFTCLVWDVVYNKWTKYKDNWSTRTEEITCYVIAGWNDRIFLCIFLKLVLKWSGTQGLQNRPVTEELVNIDFTAYL